MEGLYNGDHAATLKDMLANCKNWDAVAKLKYGKLGMESAVAQAQLNAQQASQSSRTTVQAVAKAASTAMVACQEEESQDTTLPSVGQTLAGDHITQHDIT